MIKISELKSQSNIEIPKNATKCAIVLFIDNINAGQTSDIWDLSKENCLPFGSNISQGIAYTENGTIVLENVIAYCVFFE